MRGEVGQAERKHRRLAALPIAGQGGVVRGASFADAAQGLETLREIPPEAVGGVRVAVPRRGVDRDLEPAEGFGVPAEAGDQESIRVGRRTLQGQGGSGSRRRARLEGRQQLLGEIGRRLRLGAGQQDGRQRERAHLR